MKIREINTNNLITKTRIPDGDYVINPYIGCTNGCKYCYAIFMKRFCNVKEKWGDFLFIKKCQKPINIVKLSNHTINFGTVTDAYVWQEKKYQVTRNILKELVNVQCEIIILTKNDLVLRDIDLFKQMSNIQIAFSINTTNEAFKNDMDRASPIKDRFDALKKLHENGIKTAIFISPLFPEITDWKNIINQTKSYVDEFWFEDLNLRQPFKGNIFRYLRSKFPSLIPLYTQIYNKHDIIYWKKLAKTIEHYCQSNKIKFINYFHHAQLRKK